ncbi:MAG: methyltransferase domain-containing protein [Clostridiales bacterium]|nr:methyltransferase domain-containing protein [Clostridiales bacterium]
MNEIEKYYNKFNEDKRLITRHGQIEFSITMQKIQEFLKQDDKIIDIGAGTGRYSIALHDAGYNVTAVELVKKNLSMLQQKNNNIKAFQGNALNLKKFNDESFDITLLLGPMYHLFTKEDKIRALNEAKRITKKGGYIFVAYLLTDYAILRHGIMDNNLRQSINNNKLDNNYNILSTEKDLYSYVRLPEIDEYNQEANIKRVKIFSPDGATDYIRPYINKLSEEDFNWFITYQLSNCERVDLLGASSHVVDVLKKI